MTFDEFWELAYAEAKKLDQRKPKGYHNRRQTVNTFNNNNPMGGRTSFGGRGMQSRGGRNQARGRGRDSGSFVPHNVTRQLHEETRELLRRSRNLTPASTTTATSDPQAGCTDSANRPDYYGCCFYT